MVTGDLQITLFSLLEQTKKDKTDLRDDGVRVQVLRNIPKRIAKIPDQTKKMAGHKVYEKACKDRNVKAQSLRTACRRVGNRLQSAGRSDTLPPPLQPDRAQVLGEQTDPPIQQPSTLQTDSTQNGAADLIHPGQTNEGQDIHRRLVSSSCEWCGDRDKELDVGQSFMPDSCVHGVQDDLMLILSDGKQLIGNEASEFIASQNTISTEDHISSNQLRVMADTPYNPIKSPLTIRHPREKNQNPDVLEMDVITMLSKRDEYEAAVQYVIDHIREEAKDEIKVHEDELDSWDDYVRDLEL